MSHSINIVEELVFFLKTYFRKGMASTKNLDSPYDVSCFYFANGAVWTDCHPQVFSRWAEHLKTSGVKYIFLPELDYKHRYDLHIYCAHEDHVHYWDVDWKPLPIELKKDYPDRNNLYIYRECLLPEGAEVAEALNPFGDFKKAIQELKEAISKADLMGGYGAKYFTDYFTQSLNALEAKKIKQAYPQCPLFPTLEAQNLYNASAIAEALMNNCSSKNENIPYNLFDCAPDVWDAFTFNSARAAFYAINQW